MNTNTNQKIDAIIERDAKHEASLRTCKHICNAYNQQNTGQIYIDQPIFGVIVGQMRRYLGHGTKKEELAIGRMRHLEMLSWIYGREITSTNDLTDHEKWGMLKWAEPAKLSMEGPWTLNKRVRETCEAYEAQNYGQLRMEI